ncbi:MAG: 1-deoxy-D-xylulose-5-phosphate synthase [Clostridia bacterium]|nr:1-deoxy-D-xylulose-5-phosphate synthase [Clostridia bacterium]
MKLKDITNPCMLQDAEMGDMEELARDVRDEIVRTVSRNGGHLASNLGAVELTLALYAVFDFPWDQLVWDVGHQCYTHKLLTGRYDMFGSLRQTDGICGFPRCDESPYDLFNTGHSSTALSAALGLAHARDLKKEKRHVVAVVGDGALTGGMCYEALNDIGSERTPLIMVLNDNGMSISGNVGALSNYLTYMRTSKGWQKLKRGMAKLLRKIPLIGNQLHDVFLRFKDHVRNVFVKDTFFASLGIRYLGPIDGHDIRAMKRVFHRAAEMNEPVVVHVMTRKGEGFRPAEERPQDYHGTPPFDVETGECTETGGISFGETASRRLAELAEKDERITVITAAMTYGTGFSCFEQKWPKRIFDVGIAEEHAVTLAGGMAKGGMRPVVAIYDTFMQRAYDQILEDVCAQQLPVLLLLDRAGISGADGASHHGVFGTSYLRAMPGMTVLYPRCPEELCDMIDWALQQEGPVAICYPRAAEKKIPSYLHKAYQPCKWETLKQGQDGCILAVGTMCVNALEAAAQLEKENIHIRVVHASCVNRMDETLLKELNEAHIPVFTAEENVLPGGFGSAVAEYCLQNQLSAPAYLFALRDEFIPHGDRKLLLERQGLDANHMTNIIGLRVNK